MQLAGVDGGPVRAALLLGLEDDVIDGIGKGQFSAEPDESALDLVVGALLLGILRVADRHVGVDYSHNLTANILRGLGMVSAAALDQMFASGVLFARLLRLNNWRISFTSSSTPALGEATLAKAYTSRACW